MDEETIVRAKLMAAVLCRAIDYHTATQAASRAVNDKSSKEFTAKVTDSLVASERAVAVALENLLDEGLE